MSEVRVKEGESLENALKRFKRSCAKAGVIAEVKKREHYVSPSLKRKQKSEAALVNKALVIHLAERLALAAASSSGVQSLLMLNSPPQYIHPLRCNMLRRSLLP